MILKLFFPKNVIEKNTQEKFQTITNVYIILSNFGDLPDPILLVYFQFLKKKFQMVFE